jgi:hypothetical protein
VDEEDEGRGQPRSFVVLVNQAETLKRPVNVRILLDQRERVAVSCSQE